MQICPICYDDLRIVMTEKDVHFQCDECGYQDKEWELLEKKRKVIGINQK